MSPRFWIGLAALLLPAALHAQPARPDTAARPLPEVTVTALRGPGDPLRAPLALTTLGRTEVQRAAGLSLAEVLQRVPGVLAQSRAGSADLRITIRGFGARGAGDRSNAGTSRGVRVLTDGVPETEPDGRTAFDFVDLDLISAISVVRSNASTLWGNAAGGVVAVSTRPDFGAGFAEARAATGTFGLRKGSVRVGVRQGTGLFWGGLSHATFDGWRANAKASHTTFTVGSRVLAGRSGLLSVYVSGAANRFEIPGPLTRAQFDADPQQPNATYRANRERRKNRLARVSTTYEGTLDGGTRLTVSAYANPKYLQRSERGTYRDFTRYHVGSSASAEQPVVLGRGLRGSLLVGADGQFQDGAILFYTLSPTQERGTTLRDNKGEGARSLGAFAQANVQVGERLTLALGGRYDGIVYDARSYITPRLNDRRLFDGFTPRLGANLLVRPTVAVYANLGGGVEAPAGNETDPAPLGGLDTLTALNPRLDAIRSATFEVGTKGVALVGAGPVRGVRFDAAAFLIGVRNDLVPYRGGRFYFTAGRTRRLGAEGGATVDLQGGLSLTGTLTLLRAEYRDYRVDSTYYGRPGRTADYRGNDQPGVPGRVIAGEARFAPAFLRGAFASLNLESVNAYAADDANQVEVPGHALLGASVGSVEGVRIGPGLRLTGLVEVRNLLDRRYAASAFVNPDLVGDQPAYLEPGLPRTVTVSLGLRFDR